jgi:F-type H+-transporting ATPase subunit epsilon
VVLGGFAEVSASGLTVLAEVAENVADMNRDVLTSRISALEERIKATEPGSTLDKLITRLDHYRDVDRHLIGTAMH